MRNAAAATDRNACAVTVMVFPREKDLGTIAETLAVTDCLSAIHSLRQVQHDWAVYDRAQPGGPVAILWQGLGMNWDAPLTALGVKAGAVLELFPRVAERPGANLRPG